MTAEIGRQPWIVYRVLRVDEAISRSVNAGEVLFSFIMFSLIYLLLGSLWLFLLWREIKGVPQDPDAQPASENA